jgi:hypothetical protein
MVIQMLDGEINRQALMIAYIDNYFAISIAILCVAASMFFMKPMRLSKTQHHVHLSE